MIFFIQYIVNLGYNLITKIDLWGRNRKFSHLNSDNLFLKSNLYTSTKNDKPIYDRDLETLGKFQGGNLGLGTLGSVNFKTKNHRLFNLLIIKEYEIQ